MRETVFTWEFERCDMCEDAPEPCIHCWQRRAEAAERVIDHALACGSIRRVPCDEDHDEYEGADQDCCEGAGWSYALSAARPSSPTPEEDGVARLANRISQRLRMLSEEDRRRVTPVVFAELDLAAARAETPRCPRLLVGMGDDTYDPECCLPLGHGGRCDPGAATTKEGR